MNRNFNKGAPAPEPPLQSPLIDVTANMAANPPGAISGTWLLPNYLVHFKVISTTNRVSAFVSIFASPSRPMVRALFMDSPVCIIYLRQMSSNCLLFAYGLNMLLAPVKRTCQTFSLRSQTDSKIVALFIIHS